jgi:NADH-quinone oxidoreductase subunit H
MFKIVVEKSFISLIMLISMLLCIAILTLVERKIMSSAQRRKGPNVTGVFGLLQPFADGLKLVIKESIRPSLGHWLIYFLSPIISFFITLILIFILPYELEGSVIDTSYSMLFFVALSSVSVYGIIFSGWSSNSKYALLGSFRSVSQMISYELCISSVFISVAMIGGSYSLYELVCNQKDFWNFFPLFPMWLIFFISSLAETNRTPFDLPEAEAELVSGYNIEYSAILFAIFFLFEYGHLIIFSSISTLLFFGGWNFISFTGGLSFSIKVLAHLILYILIRSSCPRYRFDHLLIICWKRMLPLCLVLILLEGAVILALT